MRQCSAESADDEVNLIGLLLFGTNKLALQRAHGAAERADFVAGVID